MKDLNKVLIELKDMLSDAMITQIDLDLKMKLVCKLNEALSVADVSSSFGGYCSKETLEGKRCKDICDKPQCGW